MKQENLKSSTKQNGTVLAIALILLLIITLAGIAAMQSSTVQERMAVGQVQMHGAFLDSEQRVWDAAVCIRSQYVGADGRLVSSLPDTDEVEALCGSPAGNERAIVEWNGDAQPSRYMIYSARSFGATGARTPVAMEVFTPGGLGGNDTFVPIPRLAPYVCFGPNCQFEPGAGQNSSAADGTNRNSVTGTACGAQGRNKPNKSDEGGIVPGVIMPEGSFTQGECVGRGNPQACYSTAVDVDDDAGGRVPDIIGDPPAILSQAAWESYEAGYIEDHKKYIDSLMDPLVAANPDGMGQVSTTLPANASGVFVVKDGQTISLQTGESAMQSGIIVLDGGTLDLQGNACFAGVVLFRNGGRVESASGTPAVLGSVIGYAPADTADIIKPQLNGTPQFFYSDKAVEDAETIIAEALGEGFVFEFARWRMPRGLR